MLLTMCTLPVGTSKMGISVKKSVFNIIKKQIVYIKQHLFS